MAPGSMLVNISGEGKAFCHKVYFSMFLMQNSGVFFEIA